MKTIREIIEGLQNVGNRSTKLLVQEKSAKALKDAKRARTLLEKAEVTLAWCEREMEPKALDELHVITQAVLADAMAEAEGDRFRAGVILQANIVKMAGSTHAWHHERALQFLKSQEVK